MNNTILSFIKDLSQPVFTTDDITRISGKSASAVTQGLNNLQKQGAVFKIHRGLWTDVTSREISPYTAIHKMFPSGRVYLSFISALHIYGIIEQIPRVITLAATFHTRTVNTSVGVFETHQIMPVFFKGFDWYKKTG
nr:type IV toxin-antitoxin system AbiEi family antitoxin domain-containing protein [Elusimicrobiota bacterium]